VHQPVDRPASARQHGTRGIGIDHFLCSRKGRPTVPLTEAAKGGTTMMKVLKLLLGVVAGLAVLVFGGAMLIDPGYAVTRSVLVNAPPERIYPLVESPKGWASWGVWYRRDPQMQVTKSGPEQGVGAAWSWTSESQGNGAMRLTEVQPGERVAYELAIEGFDPSQGDVTLRPEAGATRVTWHMHGRVSTLFARWFALFMERLVAPDFDAGLANLKALAEQPG
jgi:uncharacterized protein YndB with AHSA1/START domain